MLSVYLAPTLTVGALSPAALVGGRPLTPARATPRVAVARSAVLVVWREPTTIVKPLLANTWYTLTLATDDVRGQSLEVASGTTHSSYNVFLSSGKSCRFHVWAYAGTVYLDNCKEFGDGLGYDPDEREKFTYDAPCPRPQAGVDRLTQSQPDGTTGGYTEAYAYNAIGNLTSKGGMSYTYGDAAHKHAVTAVGGNTYTYDANGNMLIRPGQTLTWDAENRLASITAGGVITAFTYNGDGQRVKVASGGSATVYVGNTYEVITSTGAVTTYYYLGSHPRPAGRGQDAWPCGLLPG